MSECGVVKESMPLLLTESLDRSRRELSHQHIESCPYCAEEWKACRETWSILESLPEVQPPAHLRQRFLDSLGEEKPAANVVRFYRRPTFKWAAQAAGVIILAGGGYLAGHRTTPPRLQQTPARIASVQEIEPAAYSIAETRVFPTSAVSPDIQGRPNIHNVQFVDPDASDNKIEVAFDITSRVTVTGSPADKSMVRLLSYMLENDSSVTPSRSKAIEWVRQTYSDPAYAEPEIANALAKVVRNDTHEGVRIRAVEALKTLPSPGSSETREALIEALNHDSNPAVRIKAVEALANMARNGKGLDAATVNTLRQKASQDDENLYVRMKAAEALSSIRPQ